MEIIFVLLPLTLGLAVVGIVAFLWATRRGQFDDLDTPQVRVLFDESDERKRK